MPVEHEYKFLLTSENEKLQEYLEENHTRLEIHQIYCTKNNRFRSITSGKGKKARTTYFHTFKKKIEGKILEIESQVSQEDFELVQRGENLSQLYKTRYSVEQKHGQWDIDFLLTGSGGDQYFALAECEQPEGLKINVPKFLRKFITFEVPHADSTWFSNYKLSDQTYARIAIDTHREILTPWEQ